MEVYMKNHIVKDLGMRRVGKKNQHFALVRCPKCGSIDERRVRSDSNPRCRACAMEAIRSCKTDSKSGTKGDTAKNHPYHRLYRIWRGMIRRCYDPGAMGYNIYGARGVTVCDEWRNSYAVFKHWALANGYTDEMTIDKDKLCKAKNIYPKKYSPETCIWVTKSQNSTINGKVPDTDLDEIAKKLGAGESVHEIALRYDVHYKTILARTKHLRPKKYVDKTSNGKGSNEPL